MDRGGPRTGLCHRNLFPGDMCTWLLRWRRIMIVIMSSPPFLFLSMYKCLIGSQIFRTCHIFLTFPPGNSFQKGKKAMIMHFAESIPLDQKIDPKLLWKGMLSSYILRSSSTKAVFSLASLEIPGVVQTCFPQGGETGRGLQGWQRPAMKMDSYWLPMCTIKF